MRQSSTDSSEVCASSLEGVVMSLLLRRCPGRRFTGQHRRDMRRCRSVTPDGTRNHSPQVICTPTSTHEMWSRLRDSAGLPPTSPHHPGINPHQADSEHNTPHVLGKLPSPPGSHQPFRSGTPPDGGGAVGPLDVFWDDPSFWVSRFCSLRACWFFVDRSFSRCCSESFLRDDSLSCD